MADQTFHPGEVVDFELELFTEAGAPTRNFDTVSGLMYATTDPAVSKVVDEDADPFSGQVHMLVAAPGEDQKLTCDLDGDAGDGVTEIHIESETYEVVDGPARAGRLTLKLRQVEAP